MNRLPGVLQTDCTGPFTCRAAQRSRSSGTSMMRASWKEARITCLSSLCTMLMTFVHEVAHHCDFTGRIARGRWRGDRREKAEHYAESVEQTWVTSCVIPYIEKAYSNEVRDLRSWMRSQIGVEIPIELLAGDVRATARNGGVWVNATFFNTARAFEEFVTALSKEAEPLKARLHLARDLHYADLYDMAQEIVTTVLRAEPQNSEALTLRADILDHQERHEEALQIALQVLRTSPDHEDAAKVAADAYEALKQWANLREMASRLLLRQKKGWPSRRLHQQRALACIELGDFAAAETDIAELEADKRPIRPMIERLKARLQERRNEGGQS